LAKNQKKDRLQASGPKSGEETPKEGITTTDNVTLPRDGYIRLREESKGLGLESMWNMHD
jgi:hypothetical protein